MSQSSRTRRGLLGRARKEPAADQADREDEGTARDGGAEATVGAPPHRGLVHGVPKTLVIAAGWSWRILVLAAALALLIFLIITFKTIIAAVLIALLITVLLEPVAGWLRRFLRFPRALASGAAILLLLGLVSGLLVLAGRSIVDGFGALADRVTAAFDDVVEWLTTGPYAVDQQQIQQWIQQARDQVSANSDTLVSGVLGATSSVASVATGAILMLFCLFFFLKDGRKIWHWFVRLAPDPARHRINEAGIRGWATLGGYTRTQILVAFVDAVGIAVGAAILGVPLALPIGILVFLFSFIPIIGAVLSGIVAVAVALVDQGPIPALIMLGIVLLVQQLEGNVLQPWLQGNALALHPLAIVLAVTAGTGIAGLLGALFAVPVVATINTVLLYLYGRDKYPKLAADADRSGGPPGTYVHTEDAAEEPVAATPAAAATPTAESRDGRGRGGTGGGTDR
ncbi:AI-2E family transporter [Georgenia alba]|uniref:AI-2E family transporter n=1 Tax=Georgenia alba TaxID=2233858 RepID=A0ABW2Q678_9MICO